MKGIKGRNLSALRKLAAELGYAMMFAEVDAADYGLPQTRVRVWIVLRRADEVARSHIQQADSWSHRFCGILETLKCPGLISADEAMLASGSAEFRVWQSRILQAT